MHIQDKNKGCDVCLDAKSRLPGPRETTGCSRISWFGQNGRFSLASPTSPLAGSPPLPLSFQIPCAWHRGLCSSPKPEGAWPADQECCFSIKEIFSKSIRSACDLHQFRKLANAPCSFHRPYFIIGLMCKEPLFGSTKYLLWRHSLVLSWICLALSTNYCRLRKDLWN